MSAEQYIPEKYITTADAYDSQVISEELQKKLTGEEKKRFQQWVREANDKVETSLFPNSDVIPLEFGTTIYTYAKDAAINWVTWKKRDWTGSLNAKDAKSDFKENIALAKEVLKRTPTLREEPIQKADHTDSLLDYKIPYSQTQGYPPDILY